MIFVEYGPRVATPSHGPFAVGVAVTSEIASRFAAVAMVNFFAIVGCSNLPVEQEKANDVVGENKEGRSSTGELSLSVYTNVLRSFCQWQTLTTV